MDSTKLGNRLLDIRHKLLSKRLFKSMMGFSNSHLYKYQQKPYYHGIRCLIQALKFKKFGTLILDLSQEEKDFLLGIKRGSISDKEVILRYAQELQREIDGIEFHSSVPDEVDKSLLDYWLVKETVNYIRDEYAKNL